MTTTVIVISACALAFSVAALAYSVKVALVYHRFNEQVKAWAECLDDSIAQGINVAARRILSDLDARISEENNKEEKDIQDEQESD